MKIKEWMVGAVIALLTVFFIVATARGATVPVIAVVQAACPTFDAALAVVEGKDADEKNQAFSAGGCRMSRIPITITIVAILGEVVWAGDGLDDLMYMVEIEAGVGTVYSWLIAAEWPTLKAQLRGDKI